MGDTSVGIDLTQTEKDLEKERAENFDLTIEIDRLHSENDLLSSEVDELKDQLEEALKEKEESREKIEDLLEEIDFIKKVHEDAEKERTEAEGKSIEYYDDIIYELKKELAEKENNDDGAELKKSRATQSTLEEKVKKLESDLSAAKAKARHEENERKARETMVNELEATVQKLSDAVNELNMNDMVNNAIIKDLKKKWEKEDNRVGSELEECHARELALDEKVEKLERELLAKKRDAKHQENMWRERDWEQSSDIERLEREVEEMRKKLACGRGERGSDWLERDIDELKDKVQELAEAEVKAQQKNEDLEEKNRVLEAKAQELEAMKEELEAQVLLLRNEKELFEESFGNAILNFNCGFVESRSELETVTREKEELIEKCKAAEEEVKRLEESRASLLHSMEQNAKNNNQESTAIKNELKKELADAKGKIKSLENSLKHSSIQYEKCHAEKTKVSNEIQQLKDKCVQLENEKTKLEDQSAVELNLANEKIRTLERLLASQNEKVKSCQERPVEGSSMVSMGEKKRKATEMGEKKIKIAEDVTVLKQIKPRNAPSETKPGLTAIKTENAEQTPKPKRDAMSRVKKAENGAKLNVDKKGQEADGGGAMKKERPANKPKYVPYASPHTQPPVIPKTRKKMMVRTITEKDQTPSPPFDDPLSRIHLTAPPNRGKITAPPIRPAILPTPSTHPTPSLPNRSPPNQPNHPPSTQPTPSVPNRPPTTHLSHPLSTHRIPRISNRPPPTQPNHPSSIQPTPSLPNRSPTTHSAPSIPNPHHSMHPILSVPNQSSFHTTPSIPNNSPSYHSNPSFAPNPHHSNHPTPSISSRPSSFHANPFLTRPPSSHPTPSVHPHPPVPPPPSIPQQSGFKPPYGHFPPPPHLVMNLPPPSIERRSALPPPPPFVPTRGRGSWRKHYHK